MATTDPRSGRSTRVKLLALGLLCQLVAFFWMQGADDTEVTFGPVTMSCSARAGIDSVQDCSGALDPATIEAQPNDSALALGLLGLGLELVAVVHALDALARSRPTAPQSTPIGQPAPPSAPPPPGP